MLREYIITSVKLTMTHLPVEDKDGILSRIFQKSSTPKILDFFLDHKDLDYSVAEVAEKSGLSIQTVSREIINLEIQQLILKHRTIGKTHMYRLNTKLQAIVLLSEFTLQISQIPAIQECSKLPPHQDVLEVVTPNSS